MLKTQSSFDLVSKLRAYPRLLVRLLPSLIVMIFSVFYFIETCVRASGKYFWYDELFTVYICRLPTFQASWNAVLQGADFNPPLLYALTRLAHATVGEGLIGTRLPAMLGFWIFSLCLFRFVRRRCGLMAGFVAMTFPLFTAAYFYAYEARPHAIVLGFCGLALVFWQTIQERPRENRWLMAFGLSLAGASFSHCYGIVVICPFAVAEVIFTLRSHRLRWGMWAAMLLPVLASTVVIYPLYQSYNGIVQGTSFARWATATWHDFFAFYDNLLIPSLFELGIVFLVLLSFSLSDQRQAYASDQALNWTDVVLPVGFLALPVIGILLGKAFDGPFVPRYFLSALLGLSVLIGFAAGRCRPRWLAGALVCMMILILGRHFTGLLVHRHRGSGEFLAGPLAAHALLSSPEARRPLPIVVPDGRDFLYLANYDHAQESRLYYANDYRRDTFLREYGLLRTLCGLPFNPERSLDEFAKSNLEFFVYGNTSQAELWLSDYEKRGGSVKSIKFSGDQFLADVQMPQKP
jgi:hypothetical protein